MDSEEKLVADLKSGQGEAVEELVERYGNRMLKAATLLTGDYHLAQDLVQEALLQGVEKIHQFRGQSSLYTWLYRILVNRCRGEARRQQPLPKAEVEGGCQLFAGERAGPAQVVERAEGRQMVTTAVMDLAHPYREVIALHYFEELSVAQMAQLLGERSGTLKSRLHRARALLAKALAEEGYSYDGE